MLEKDLFAGVVTSLCFHSEKVIVVGHGPFLKLYNVLTGKLLTCQEVLPNNRIHRITFVPKIDINQGTETRMMAVYGSKYIAIVKITIVEDEDHASIDIIESLGPFCDWILDVQWLKVGEHYSQLAIAYAHNFVEVYNLNMMATTTTKINLELIYRIQCEVRCILYSARFYGNTLTELILASGTVFNQVHVWKVTDKNEQGDGHVCRELLGHEGVIFGVRFSEDGSMLVSVSDDRTIRVWSMVNLKQAPLVVYGHTARVWDCQIVGEYLVSISEDATCRVWKNAMMANDNKDSIDLGDTSMDCLACWEGHTGKNIWSAAVSPDHRIVATGGQDSGIRLWSLTSIKENNIVSEDDLACMRLPEQYKGDMIRNFGLINHKTLMASTDHGHLIRFDASTNIPGWSDVYQDDDLRGYSILQQSSCGRLLVAGSMNGGLLFYSTQDEFKSLKLDIHSQKIFEIFIIASQVNKDLFYIVSYGYNGDIYFHLLDTSDPTKTTVSTPYMLKLPECRTTLVSAALVESKGVLICGSRESTMLIYRLPDFTIDHFHHNNKLPVHPAIQVDKVHGKQCISGITIKQSSSSSMISPFTEEDCITFWTTGRDGCYIEYRLKTANARNSSFSPDQQEAISVNQDLILEKVYRNKVTKGWLEGAVYVDDELLLLGFYRKSFFVYNETKHFEMISVACGGAHRRWHFNTLDARLNHASFAFIRKEAIYAYIRDGSNSTNGFQEITLQSNFHGREVRAMKYLKLPANSGDHSNQPIVFATGGEDTILRIHQYIPKESKFVTHSTIRKHKSVIKCIEWSHGNETLLFTAGGTEEFRCWKLEMYQDHENSLVVNCLEWAVCPVVSDERIETRIMDLTTIVIDSSRGLHLVGAVYSDAMIRIWLFNEKTRQFSLIVDGTWHAKCILQITHLVLAQENEKNRILFFTSATDGKVAIWDISEELYSVLENVEQVEMDPTKPAIKLSQPLGFYLVHMSGVNALEVMDFDKDHILILTGGEDNSVAATLVNKRNWKMVDDGPCNVPNAHASSITGIYLIDHMDTQKRAMATVSTDQRLNIWMIESIDKGSLAVNLVDTVFVDIPDPSALDGIRLDGQLHFTSTGIGLQSFKFIHDHL